MAARGIVSEDVRLPGHDDRTNILIVDDLPEKLLVFQTILEDLGQNLIMVRSGSEALAEVLRREFAVMRSSCSTSTCPTSTGWRRPA
jgi:DNA-binding NtrC family response regulator